MRGFSFEEMLIFSAEILFLLIEPICAYLSNDNDVLDSFPPRILIHHLLHGPQQVLREKKNEFRRR